MDQCEECEELPAQISCVPCGQILCENCDKKIHNKGKRVLHSRETIKCKSDQNRKQDAHILRHEQHKERFKQIKRLESQQVLFSQEITTTTQHRFQNHDLEQVEMYLFKKAFQGELMISMPDFHRYLKSKSVKWSIEYMQQQHLLQITTRKFGDSDAFEFVSLQLEEVSLQSLYWILLNIRKDEMTPTDKLVMSRIKECFGIKLTIAEWNDYLAGLYKLQDQDGNIIFTIKQWKLQSFEDSEIIIKMNKCPTDLLNSNSNQNEALLLFTIEDNITWHMRDAQQMSSTYKQQWRVFIQYLSEFFDHNLGVTTSQDTQSLLDESSQSSIGAQSVPTQKNNLKWVKSVESGNQSYQSNATKKKNKCVIKPPKSISKAIPGGKYGCAQLLKCCGPIQLRLCTLGLLCLIIQEAINRSILIYYKTLLIKPNNNLEFDFNDYMTLFDEETDLMILQQIDITPDDCKRKKEEQQDKLQQVQQIVREILMEYKKGVSLARLPKLIQRKIHFNFDLHELGFTKLKCFIQSVDGVNIVNDGTTYASVIIDEKQNSFHLSQINQSEIVHHTTEQQLRIDNILRMLLHHHPYGIPSQQLYLLLQQHLQTQFDYQQFRCTTFEEYLVKYADSYCDVMVKVKGCVVYLKYLPPQPPQIFHHQKSQSTNLPSYGQLQSQNNSQQIKADSTNNSKFLGFLAGMQLHQEGYSQSLTFQSFNTNPQILNRDFFMIQEESSQYEIDANVKFIEELLKESDEEKKPKKGESKYYNQFKHQSPRGVYHKIPDQLHSWDFDNNK